MNFFNGVVDTFEMSGAELECTQYWELIEEKEPLFVTEEGVEVFDKNINFIVVDCDFEKIYCIVCRVSKTIRHR